MKLESPYSREEVKELGHESPERGLLCSKCGARIPQFRDLSDSDHIRIRQLISNNKKILAMLELRAATGCSLGWAKLWVIHEDQKATVPCPYCGEPLRTPVAKQCRFCGRDWHDQQ